ncbi:4-aminobutyrate--2-oxoglutarate transaminase [Alteromonas ponticola]|uniref:4-aminobutyrate--2-oxoglutarate transaminase n=1 Tax=Alteromonas ponticola TaxID=2720613 RepID=A0ABX1R3N2_9ALTE|nr:4-aminobutyrate--2-oxoglutarate transaminase [Alteromonas ponticola]NMH60271.1 4-aminobutyrate--2-oxoglutarate transaminase [Alteromonas ponticola]
MATNLTLQQRKQAVFANGQGNLYPVYVSHAKNAEMWDVEGNRYLDFGTGIAVCNTGHAHPKIVKAVNDQMEKFSHSCVMVNPYESAVELAEKLTQLAPGDSPKKAMFVTTGAEAVENAVKIARAHTGRRGVIAFNGGFHGRTNLTMGLTGKITPYKDFFGPFPGEIYHAPFPNPLHGITAEQSLAALAMLMKVDISPKDVAAIIIEPIQGEGGFYVAPPEFLKALRALCDEHGIMLICDEIQSGFARTGHMFYTEAADIEPDLMTMAKGIAGGIPISAVVGKANVMDTAPVGGLGGTYGGSPLGCAAAVAVLDVIKEEKLAERATMIEGRFYETLNALKAKYPKVIAEVRGHGAMIALELMSEGDPAVPNPALTKAVIGKALDYGLILLACGFYGNVIRFLPPLTIPETHLREGLDQFTALFDEVMKG